MGSQKRIIVTGGLGFIGSAVVRRLIDTTDHVVMNVDCQTYAATTGSVAAVADSPRYDHAKVDITDGAAVDQVIAEFNPTTIMHLAAESHVDRSIDDPGRFIKSNVLGTYELLRSAAAHAAAQGSSDDFRFINVSTDEVFGSLDVDDEAFNEDTSYDPRSPYSASKAAADHLARAWHEAFGLPTIVTNCSNNYGPFHFPEKLIPLMILKARAGEPLPVYGSGANVRDWIHVEDHAAGLVAAAERGTPGSTYLFGGRSERTNLDVVESICDLLDERTGVLQSGPRRDLISFVSDRPGHDLRYAIDCTQTEQALGWEQSRTFDAGLSDTIDWYLDNEWWWGPLADERYAGERLGSGA